VDDQTAKTARRAAVCDALAWLGVSMAELAQQAKTGQFSSPEAKNLWSLIGPVNAPDPGE